MSILRVCIASVVAMSFSGCAQAVLIGYLIGGPPSIEPDFDSMTSESLSAPDTRVAVICYAPTELKWDFEKLDKEIAEAVTYRLGQNHVKVLRPEYVQGYIDEHPDWEQAEEIGEYCEADYVVSIEISDFGLYEENSTTLYRGRTEAFVHVIKMDEFGEGDRIYTKELNSLFPTSIPRSVQDQSFESFKREYLSNLSEQIGWLFYEHFNGDRIPWAT